MILPRRLSNGPLLFSRPAKLSSCNGTTGRLFRRRSIRRGAKNVKRQQTGNRINSNRFFQIEIAQNKLLLGRKLFQRLLRHPNTLLEISSEQPGNVALYFGLGNATAVSKKALVTLS